MTDTFHDGHFVGTLEGKRRVNALTLAETSYRPRLIVGAHAHESGLVTLVLEGALTEECGRRRALCEKGSLIFHPPNEPHGHRFSDTGGRCFVLQLGAEWAARMGELSVGAPQAPLEMRRTKANWIATLLHEEFRSDDAAASLTIEGLTLVLLGEIGRVVKRSEAGAKPGWLIRAVEMLHAHLDGSLTMAEIAEAVGVHPVHLSRTFHQKYGCTMGEYVRRQRIDVARRALVTTDRSLAEIAHAAGFSDQSHFSRVFKRLVGTSPGAYRRSAAP